MHTGIAKMNLVSVWELVRFASEIHLGYVMNNYVYAVTLCVLGTHTCARGAKITQAVVV